MRRAPHWLLGVVDGRVIVPSHASLCTLFARIAGKMVDMLEHLGTATTLYKGGKAVAQFLERQGRTEDFKEARNAMAFAWVAEMAERLAENERASREAFLLTGGTLVEHERRLEEVLGPEVEVLMHLYGEAAYKEAQQERRRMLQHAAAALIDLDVRIEEKCRIEKVLRDLDPQDVLELDRLGRVAGNVERDESGRLGFARVYETDRAFLFVMLTRSRSGDALISSGCVRTTPSVGQGSVRMTNLPADAHVTRRGRLVLFTLRTYIAHRRLPAPGRELTPGSRPEVEARALLAGIEGLSVGVARAARDARRRDPTSRQHDPLSQVQFDFVKPKVVGDAHDRAVKYEDVPPATRATLHVNPVSRATADALRAVRSVDEARIRVVDCPDGEANVTVEGPFDIIRWLAEDVEAWWT
jgi:hypothetical protein